MSASALPSAAKPANPPPAETGPWWQHPFALTLCVVGAFLLLVSATMVFRHRDFKTQDLLTSPELAALQEKLHAAPKDDKIKQQIRELDLELRHRYFSHLASVSLGGWMLVGGLGLFLLTAAQLKRKRRKMLAPRASKQAAAQLEAAELNRMRWAVAGMGVLLGAALLAVGANTGTQLPSSLASLEKKAEGVPGKPVPPARNYASYEELQKNWPQFRGVAGGVALQTNVPLNWDVKSGPGVLWKSAVPAPGFNSPVVWNDRVFLAGGDKTNREVICYEARSGELLWRRPVKVPPPGTEEEWEMPELAGMAAPTMAVDGKRAYAIFANGDLAAFDFEGNPVWGKCLGRPHNPHGHSSSLALWQDRLIVLFDQGESDERKGRLYAFDGATGNVVWEKTRPVGSSWASPIVVEAAGKPQVITLAVPWIIAYSATDGSELWRVECLNGEVTPSPVSAAGLILVASPSEKLFGIKPDGQGDVTKTHVAWTADENIPDISSPVSNGELVFVVTTPGYVTCYDVKDGKKVWEHDFETECQSSPSIVGQRLYLFGVKGEVIVLEAGREFKELAKFTMAEPIYASPAFVDNRIFIRGAKHLYCVGVKEGN